RPKRALPDVTTRCDRSRRRPAAECTPPYTRDIVNCCHETSCDSMTPGYTGRMDHELPPRRRSRAVHLLQEIIESCAVDRSRIARKLRVPDEVLAAYVDGTREM